MNTNLKCAEGQRCQQCGKESYCVYAMRDGVLRCPECREKYLKEQQK